MRFNGSVRTLSVNLRAYQEHRRAGLCTLLILIFMETERFLSEEGWCVADGNQQTVSHTRLGLSICDNTSGAERSLFVGG